MATIVLLLLGCSDAPPAPGPAAPPPQEILGAVLDGRADARQLAGWEAMLASREPNAGPHLERIFRARSPDGLSFDLANAELLREHAAVPDAVTTADGRTFVYFVEGDIDRARSVATAHDPWMRTHGILGFGAIDMMTQGPGGSWATDRRFVVHGIVHGMVVDPVVRALPGGGWRLYYLGVPVEQLLQVDAWKDGSAHTVYSARSTDLLEWSQEGEVVRGPNADPAVWCDGDWCLMISTGLDRSSSTDGGRTFAFEGPIGVPGFAPTFLDLPDGRLRLYYNSKDRGGPLRSMISVDRGRTWVAERGDRVPAYTVEAPSFQPHPEGGWWMYYHYWQEGISPDMFEKGFLRKESAG